MLPILTSEVLVDSLPDSDLVARNRFTSILALAEEKLRSGEFDAELAAFVKVIRNMAATSDAVNDAMCESDELAHTFDAVVTAYKEGIAS